MRDEEQGLTLVVESDAVAVGSLPSVLVAFWDRWARATENNASRGGSLRI